jgi:hypothetical protein
LRQLWHRAGFSSPAQHGQGRFIRARPGEPGYSLLRR